MKFIITKIFFFLIFMLTFLTISPSEVNAQAACFVVRVFKLSGPNLPSPGQQITVRVEAENKCESVITEDYQLTVEWALNGIFDSANMGFFSANPNGSPLFTNDIPPFGTEPYDFTTTIQKNDDICATSGQVKARGGINFGPGETVLSETSNVSEDLGGIGARLTGVVKRADGSLAGGVRVNISSQAGFFASTTTNASGFYEFNGLNCNYSHTVRTDDVPGQVCQNTIGPAPGGLCNGQTRTLDISCTIPCCNSTPVCSGSCTSSFTCFDSNTLDGTEGSCVYTTHSSGGSCRQCSAPDQPCTIDCPAGEICSDGVCIAPEPSPIPTLCGTPPGRNSWRWKTPGVDGYACQRTQNVCPSNACVGVPYTCQNGTWVNTNTSGECTTLCFGFCSVSPSPSPPPPPPSPSPPPPPPPSPSPSPSPPPPPTSAGCSVDEFFIAHPGVVKNSGTVDIGETIPFYVETWKSVGVCSGCRAIRTCTACWPTRSKFYNDWDQALGRGANPNAISVNPTFISGSGNSPGVNIQGLQSGWTFVTHELYGIKQWQNTISEGLISKCSATIAVVQPPSPWIQTSGGDVHSQEGIFTPGGP